MPDEKGELREINYRQLLPWTELFRSFHIALLDPRKLFLAALGIFFMSLGWWILAHIFGNPTEPRREDYTAEQLGVTQEKARAEYERAVARTAFLRSMTDSYKTMPWDEPRGENPYRVITHDSDQLLSTGFWTSQVPVLLEPLTKFVRPIVALLHPDAGFWLYVFCILGILWTLAVWAVFGGAITRIAAVKVARNEQVSLGDALRFSVAKFLSYFAAPLYPALGVAVIVLVMVLVGGLLFLVPYVGDVLGAVLWFLVLIGGLIMAGLLIGYVGWPLMYATISTEGSDSFDAFSRCYQYVYQRPWHYLFYTLVALLYGVLAIFFVVFLTSFFVYLGKFALDFIPWLDWRATGEPASALSVYAPTSYGWRDLLVGEHRVDYFLAEMNTGQQIGAVIVGFWLTLIFLMMVGFAYSYFWTFTTIIYFLLRQQIDHQDFDEVYYEEDEEAYPVTAASAPAAPAATEPVRAATLPLAPPAPEPTRAEPPKPPEPTRTEPPRTEPTREEPPKAEVPKPEPPKPPPDTGNGNPPPKSTPS